MPQGLQQAEAVLARAVHTHVLHGAQAAGLAYAQARVLSECVFKQAVQHAAFEV